MNKTILVTQPNHDLTTKYISSWAEKVVALAKKKNVKVIALKSKRANKKEFILLNQKTNPRLIFFNGHGNDDLISGQNNEILVQAGKNDDCLRGKIIYALSCRSAKKLGKSSIKKGTKAYLGYKEDFIFNYNQEKVSAPLQDKIAQMFLEPSNLLVSLLVENHSTGKAWKKSQEDFKKKAISIIAGRDKVAINSFLPCLLWDMKHQVCLGNKKAIL
jgi:hypothetical protein